MLVLRYSDSELGYSWFIRSLKSDGAFFGDITDKKRFQQRNFQGCFASDSFVSLETNLNDIDPTLETPRKDDSNALFRFCIGYALNDAQVKVSAESFHSLPEPLVRAIEIIEPRIFDGLILRADDQWIVPLRFRSGGTS